MKHLKKLSDDEARALLERLRWPDGPVCALCGSDNVASLNGSACRAGLKKCRACRKQFTVTVGTIFERSHISLSEWIYAFHSMCASKKGISALQLQRELSTRDNDDNKKGTKMSYKTAWFMCHRIREAMKDDVGPLGFNGAVEIDESYVGGKPRPYGKPGKPGRGTSKTPIMALVERDGRAKVKVIADVTAKTLRKHISENVDPTATLHTDEWPGYKDAGIGFAGHHRVNHSHKQYVGDFGASTNTVESFFALIKRGVYGNFHNVSKKHLDRYCHEFAFRWNFRKVTDEERTFAALRQANGKRLTYVQPLENRHSKG